MQAPFTSPPPQPAERTGSVALLKILIARHPYATTLFFLVYWLALLLASGRLLTPVYLATHMPLLLYEAMGEVLLVLIVLLPTATLRWWADIGLARGVNGRGILLCLLPAILIVGPALLALPLVASRASILILIVAIILSLLVGLAEEGMFRGILLRCLLPKGIWPAVLLSTLCFTVVHLTNLLGGASWGYVSGQFILTLGVGILFAALRLRTSSLWPGILLHAARDVVGLIDLGINPALIRATPSSASYTITIVFCLMYLCIAFVLLRPSQVRKLEFAYGLVKQPAAGVPGNWPYPGTQQPQGYTSYPTYRDQLPPPAPLSMPQPPFYPEAMAYREYTSPDAYRTPPQSRENSPDQ